MDEIIEKWSNNLIHNIFLIYGDILTLNKKYEEINKKYNVKRLIFKDFKNIKIIEKEIMVFIQYNDFFNNSEKIVIIEDLTLMNNKQLNLIKSLFLKKKIKCVLLSENNSHKIKKVFEKYIDIFKYNRESNSLYIDDILKKRNINFNKPLKMYISKITNNNIKRTNEIIDIITIDEKKKYKLNDYKDFLNTININFNNEIKLFNITNDIFNNKNNTVEDIINYYNIEKTQLPLTLYENYHKFITNKTKKVKEQHTILNLYKNISENISQGEVVNTFMIKNQKWLLNENIALYQCFYPSKLLNKYERSKKFNNIPITFSNIIAQDSILIRKNNMFYKLLRSFNTVDFDYDILDYKLKYMFYLLISDNEEDIKRGLKILYDYNLDVKSLDKLLNVFNNEKIKKIFSFKFKKKLKSIKL